MTDEERTAQIFEEAEKISQKLGKDMFDREKYERDAAALLDGNGSLSILNPENYTRQSNSSYEDTKGKRPSTSLKYKDGIYSFTNNKGQTHQASNFYDIASKVAQQYKELDEKSGTKRAIAFHCYPKNPEEIALNAKAFINNGVMINPKGDIPQSPEFWSQFKQEYLQNNHTEKDWDTITANLPAELLGRSDKQRPITKSDIAQFRNGINPYKNTVPHTTPTKKTIPTNQDALHILQQKKKQNSL